MDTGLRVLIGEGDSLEELYAPPRTPWLRVNMVSTVDGAATGDDGRSGGINNAVDKRVFHTLRSMCDAIVVGAGTARNEGYRPATVPIVLVSRVGEVPVKLREAEPGTVLMATTASSPGLADARDLLGDRHVLVCGDSEVDLARLRSALVERGLVDLLSEGGPHLLRAMLAQGVVDELTQTFVPRLIAGEHVRVTAGPPVDVPLSLELLLESEGTLLGRWFVQRSPRDSGRPGA